MESEQLINDYVDGLLEPENEPALFLELSSNDELRMKLKHMLAIKNSIITNSSVFAPPVESTDKIFSALGFTSHTPKPASPFINGWKSSYFKRIAAGTIALLALLFFSQLSELNQNQSPRVTGIKPAKQAEPAVPLVSSREGKQVETPKVVIRYIYRDRLIPIGIDSSLISKSDPQEIIPQVGIVHLKQENFLVLNNGSITQNPTLREFANSEKYEPQIDFEGLKPSGIDIELIGSQYFMLPAATVQPSKNALFNNNGIVVRYGLNDNFALGLDLRQETFYQEFRGMDEKGIVNNYYQQPNFTSFGITGRYKYNAAEGFYPFAQVYGGGNKAGIIYRGMLGVEFAPYRSASFSLGIEYSNMIFNHQGSSYNAGKIGINYGVSFKF